MLTKLSENPSIRKKVEFSIALERILDAFHAADLILEYTTVLNQYPKIAKNSPGITITALQFFEMRILGSPYNSEKLNNTQKIWLTRCISKRLHSDKYAKAAHGYRALFDDKMSGQKKSPSGIALSKRILILPAAARTMALQTFDNWSATSNFQREATPDGDAMTTLALSFLRDYPELKK